MSNLTTITLPREVKEDLDKAKVHRREPYYEVIERLLKEKLKEKQLVEVE